MTTINSHKDLEKIFRSARKYQEHNKLDKACHLYQTILTQIPDSPLVNYNYGLALYELGHYEKSRICYINALKQAPGHVDILYNLALCYKKLGDFDETVEIYEKILKSTPDDLESIYNLGCCFKDMGEDEKATLSFLKVLELSSDHQPSMNNLAYLYHKNDDHKNASYFYSLLLQINPEHVQAKHMLAALQGQIPETAPLQYIENVFDEYSNHYDDSLVRKLHYNVPALLSEHFCKTFKIKPHSLNTLDLGCGTGLSGRAFKELSSSLTGVDISQKMLNIAADKGIYDSLHASGIKEYLQNTSFCYNLIIAADVFTYLGDLKLIFELLFNITEHGAFFCFSVEECDNDHFELSTTGRFAHSFSYIEKVSLKAGWNIIDHFHTDLRKEKDQWIRGMLFFLQKEKHQKRLVR